MIFFDVTKTGTASHRSGLTRVSERLRAGLGDSITAIAWDVRTRQFAAPTRGPSRQDDWFLTAELFSEAERPGFTAFLQRRGCRRAAIFHDAIPLRHPHITWPQSVARHPGYLKLLAEFDRVWAVSEASRRDLLGYWHWLGVAQHPPVEVIALGADLPGVSRAAALTAAATPRLLCIGIIEPRKNQRFLLEVCADLWNEGVQFELHLIGRVNPHFGRPIVARIAELQRTRADRLYFHEAADDAEVLRQYARAHATLFPTIAEGCGLPLLESLWLGVPCVCSDLPVLRENADGGGCVPATVNDSDAWKNAIRRVLGEPALHRRLSAEAASRPLPTWAEAARMIARTLR